MTLTTLSSAPQVVFGHGPTPALLMIVGQNPGKHEAREGKPFVGASGAEQRAYLRRAGINVDDAYVTNVSKTYNAKDAPLTPKQIVEWTPLLEAEVAAVRPLVIAAVGAYATRWFLGDAADFTACQGLPHRAGEFDPSIAYRACGAVIVPVLHPAAAMRDDKGDKRALCARDYQAVGDTLRAILAGDAITYRHDEYAGREHYVDASGADVARLLDGYVGDLAIDTEGEPNDPISVQVSIEPGTGYMLWCDANDFAVGAAAIQAAVDRGCYVVTHDASTPHRCMHDTVMCRAVGIELGRARNTFNTMLALYEMRLEPWGLKPASWRWLRAQQDDYMGLVAGLARERQLAYLDRIANHSIPLLFDATPVYTKAGKLAKRQPTQQYATWPKLEPTVVLLNDGTLKVDTVQRPNITAARLARDVRAGKVDNKGEPVSIEKRYAKWKLAARKQVEAVYGKLPTATLRDVPRADAVRYGARDADLTLRLAQRLRPELERLDLTRTIAISGAVLPIYESAQRTGLPASRSKFLALHEHLSSAAATIQARISSEFFGGRPFNPMSRPHAIELMRRRGLKGAKRTKTGEISAGKKSIEHYRFKDKGHYDPAMALLTDWREHKHVDNMYCKPVLRRLGSSDDDTVIVNPNWKPMGTVTGRPAVDKPPLLAFPKHEKPSGINYGAMLRNCFVCPPGTTLIEVDLCLVPETKVLTADLRWVRIDSLLPGDRVVSIDEDRPIIVNKHGVARFHPRRLRTASVEAVKRNTTHCFALFMDNGTTLVASAEHPWLARQTPIKDKIPYEWVRTDQLKPGDRLRRLVDPWEADTSWESGWLARFFDGEGSLDTGQSIVTLTQNAGPVFDHACNLLKDMRYDFHEPYTKTGAFPGSKSASQVWMCGMTDCMRFLGSVRPKRLLAKAEQLWEGKEVRQSRYNKLSPNSPARFASVVAVLDVGEQETIALQTSTKTFVAEGFFTHNSQIELRMFAHESGDDVMCSAFINAAADPDGEYDLHTATASKIFNVPYRQVTKLQRTLAKNINFGTLYGIQGYGLLDQMRQRGLTGYSLNECEEWRMSWRRIYRRGWQYIGDVEQYIERHGYIRDWSGHYRYLAGVWSPDDKTSAEAKRQGVNLVIQGGAGAYMKCAMAWLWPHMLALKDAGEFVDLALMVYDSLVFWCSEGVADRVEALAKEALEHHGGITLRVPVACEASRATSWGAL